MAENGLQSQLRGFGVDVGGSGIKGALVDLNTGQLIGERIRIATPQPATPDAVADVVAEITHRFGWEGPRRSDPPLRHPATDCTNSREHR